MNIFYVKYYGSVQSMILSQPLPPHHNTIVEFKDQTAGPNLPKVYVPAVKKGFLFMCEKGM